MWKKEYQDLLFPVDENHIGLQGFYMRKITGDNIDIPDEHMLKQIHDLKLDNLPKYLYRYRQFDTSGYSLDNLTNDSLWFSEPKCFNDPFDSRNHSYTLDFIEAQIDFVRRFEEYFNKEMASFKNEHSNDSSLHNSIIQQFENSKTARDMAYYIQFLKDSGEDDEGLHKAYIDAFEYILSNFTSSEWESHKTITNVMHEKIEMLDVIHNDANRVLTKVCSLSEVNNSILMWSHYADSHRGFCIEYELSRLPLDSGLLNNLHPVIYHDVAEGEAEDRLKGIKYYRLYSVLRKSFEWNYEKEWRFVYSHDDFEGNVLKFPTISAVYLGYNVEEEYKKKILEIAKKKEIKVYKTQLKGRALEFIQLPIE